MKAIPTMRGIGEVRGFSLIELMLALVIVAIISSVAYPLYTDHVNKLKVNEAITEIKEIEAILQRYYTENGRYPDTIAALNLEPRLQTDPWDSQYQFLNIENAPSKALPNLRKDKNLVPINSDYDLYSHGADKSSVGPLTGKPSHDDIVRGRNGGFVGLATDF